MIPDPDPAIMASMTCEPVDKDLLDELRSELGTPTRSIQVEVGEGLNPGEDWWLVILDSPADDSYAWGLRHFLTNAPGGGPLWIPLPQEDPWMYVQWDAERLTRAQSALVKAQGCLS
ncbi:MAG TPA: hypothetical protein GXZ30_04610 [Propionibacterium sp.]|jgi:hypothetical protein|nr:hypothetical protein [Propionibacterium sp.]